MKYLRSLLSIISALVGFVIVSLVAIAIAKALWPIIADSLCTSEPNWLWGKCRLEPHIYNLTVLSTVFLISVFGPIVAMTLCCLSARGQANLTAWISLGFIVLPILFYSYLLSDGMNRADELLIAWLPPLFAILSGVLTLQHFRRRQSRS